MYIQTAAADLEGIQKPCVDGAVIMMPEGHTMNNIATAPTLNGSCRNRTSFKSRHAELLPPAIESLGQLILNARQVGSANRPGQVLHPRDKPQHDRNSSDKPAGGWNSCLSSEKRSLFRCCPGCMSQCSARTGARKQRQS